MLLQCWYLSWNHVEISLLHIATDSTPHTWYTQLLRKFTSPTINYFIGLTGKGMKTNWLSSIFVLVLPYTLSLTHLFLFCLSLWPAPQLDMNTKPTRPDPEGESSPPKTDKTQRMESPIKKDADRRLTTPTKSDVIPRSPGSPASPVPRSKRKEGKGKYTFHLCYFYRVQSLKGKIYNRSWNLAWHEAVLL